MRADKKSQRWIAIFLLLGFVNAAAAQSVANTSADQAVRDALKVFSSGYYTGSTEKELAVLGDAAAIELIKLFAARDLTTQEIKSSVQIVRMSFSAPKLIVTQADRQPKATLFLLRYLEYQAKEQALKQDIVDTSKSLQTLLR